MSEKTREEQTAELRQRIEKLQIQDFWDEVLLDECSRDPSAIAKIGNTTRCNLREAEEELSRLTTHS